MSIRDFLHKYSSIPNSFIDDFHTVYNQESRLDYKVNLDVASKWLESRSSSLKKTIIGSYIENQDFIRKEVKGNPGTKKEEIWMTPDCFKYLCMRSQTEKSQMVRSYYIQLEKLIEKYYREISEKLEERVKELERNQRPKYYEKGEGFIYVIKASGIMDSVFKLGKSKDLKGRLRSYNSGRMDDIEPVYVVKTENIDAVERCMKAFLKEKQYRKIKEVYETDLSVIKQLLDDCSSLALKTYYKNPKVNQGGGGGYYFVLDKEA
jgi:phage anti-repressor protein